MANYLRLPASHTMEKGNTYFLNFDKVRLEWKVRLDNFVIKSGRVFQCKGTLNQFLSGLLSHVDDV